jgi:hypothetical protein
LVVELPTSHNYEKEWGVLYQNFLASEAWEEKYPSREFWADPRIWGKKILTHKIRKGQRVERRHHQMEKRMFRKILWFIENREEVKFSGFLSEEIASKNF